MFLKLNLEPEPYFKQILEPKAEQKPNENFYKLEPQPLVS